METATKRPRGRPRNAAPPRPIVHVRILAALKAQLERDAEEANRSLTKEIEVRLEQSYLRDELYGGSRMASMFREMAEVAIGFARHKNLASFFEDFEVFVFARDVWDAIIRSRMPRPNDELLDDVVRRWDTHKAGAPQTSAQMAAREWLIRHTHTSMTLAEALAGAFEPTIGRLAGTRESPSERPAGSSKAVEGEDTAIPAKPMFSLGSLAKVMEGLTPSEGAVSPIGSLAKAMEGLIPSQGSIRAAAGEVSRLVRLLADAIEEETANHSALSPINPDQGAAAVER